MDEFFPCTPRKILILGTLGSGKTTQAKDLAARTGYPYVSIDECRIRHSDSTMDGEDRAWEHFLVGCASHNPAILEFSGGGPHIDEVHEALHSCGMPVFIIWLDLPLDTCSWRASQRLQNVPSPFPWGPIEASVPAIHTGIEFAWDTVWSREPGYQVMRMKLQNQTSRPEVFSTIVTFISTRTD